MALSLEDLISGNSLGGLSVREYRRMWTEDLYYPSVCCTFEIGNRTQYRMDNMRSTNFYGYFSDPPQTILPGRREVMFCYKNYSTCTGIQHVISWMIDIPGAPRRIAIEYCLPYNFNHHVNQMAVGITDPGATNHSDAWRYDMYYGEDGRSEDLNFIKDDYYYRADTISTLDNELEVHATMGIGHKPSIIVEVRCRDNPGWYETNEPPTDEESVSDHTDSFIDLHDVRYQVESNHYNNHNNISNNMNNNKI